MGNLLKDYENRNAGLSPDHIRIGVKEFSQESWRGVALDVGMGSGGWAKFLRESNKFDKIIGTDLLDCRAENMKDIEFYVANLAQNSLPISDNSFDCIFAIEVLEHIENPRFFVREMYRLLKPGGSFFMTTPSCDCLTSKISFLFRGYFPPFCEHDYVGSGHITPVTSLDLRRMCKEAKFSKVIENFSMPGRIPSVKLYWQSLFPFLKGKLWSDAYFARCIK